jgi:hypothetical protein
MRSQTEKVLPAILFSPMKRADILDIRSPLDGHLPPPGHFPTGGTGDDSVLDGKGCRRGVSAVSGNNGFGFHLGEDIGKDLFGVVVGIPDDAFWRKGKRFSSLPEKRNGLLFLVMVRRKSLLMERKL